MPTADHHAATTPRTWRRELLVTLITASVVFALVTLTWDSSYAALALRIYLPAAACLLVFATTERWPRELPSFLARWALQVVAVALVVPLVLLAIYLADTPSGGPPFWREAVRAGSFGALVLLGMLVSSWVAMTAIMRERDTRIVQTERARAQTERQALDTRLRLLQAQVEPHFLFNTLGAVQSLVDSRSPQASAVLGHLVAYLRASVPRLDGRVHDFESELQIARAYLAVMQMRIPDRLQFTIDVDERLLRARCPQLAVMTLVENAIRHGIDPSVEGGRVDITIREDADGHCRVQVRDSGVGLSSTGSGTGTGLLALRERLRHVFPGRSVLDISGIEPHGVLAEIRFPVERA